MLTSRALTDLSVRSDLTAGEAARNLASSTTTGLLAGKR